MQETLRDRKFQQIGRIIRSMKNGQKAQILDLRIERWGAGAKEGIFYLFTSDREGWKLLQIRCCQDPKEYRTQIGYQDSEKYNVNAYVFLEARLQTQLRSGYFAGYSQELPGRIFEPEELRRILFPRMEEIESSQDAVRILEAERRGHAGDSDDGTE